MPTTTDNDKPLVSIIVPTHNRSRLLAETISSVLSQDFNSFEVIIVENSPDGRTERYLDSVKDRRLRYFVNPADSSKTGIVASNRNMGIEKARGRYISFCDDDDLWEPDKLSMQTGFMEGNPDIGLSFGYVKGFGNPDINGQLYFSKKECDSAVSYERLLLGNKIATLSVMVRASCLKEVGPFDEALDFKAIEDYDLWLRIARRYEIACMPAVLGSYRVHAGGISRDEVLENKKLLRLLEKFRKNGWVSGRLARQVESNIDRMIANAMLLGGDKNYRGSYMRSARLCMNKNTALGLGLCLLPTTMASRVLKWLKRSKRKRLHKAE